MVRVLILFDQQADLETKRGALGLVRSLGDEFAPDFRTLGFGGDWRDVPSAAALLRRMRGKFDIVHAWGGSALAIAALGTNLPIAFSPTASTTRRTIHWLRAILSYRHVEAIAPTTTLRRKLVERGIPIERCHLIRPGVELARIKRRHQTTLRADLGFADDDYVMLAPGESTRGAAHDHALWTATVLHVLDIRYKLLIWGRGSQLDRIRNLSRKMGALTAVCIAEQKLRRKIDFEELPAVADAVIVSAAGPVATLPIATCMAAGSPIVARTSYTVGELLEDRHTALMTGSNNHRDLARRILDLRADSAIQWSIADMAKTEAFEYFSFTRFVNQYRSVYRQLAAGERVNVPEDAPGAGLRFHGRG